MDMICKTTLHVLVIVALRVMGVALLAQRDHKGNEDDEESCFMHYRGCVCVGINCRYLSSGSEA